MLFSYSWIFVFYYSLSPFNEVIYSSSSFIFFFKFSFSSLKLVICESFFSKSAWCSLFDPYRASKAPCFPYTISSKALIFSINSYYYSKVLTSMLHLKIDKNSSLCNLSSLFISAFLNTCTKFWPKFSSICNLFLNKSPNSPQASPPSLFLSNSSNRSAGFNFLDST